MRFGGLTALNDFSMDVRKGSIEKWLKAPFLLGEGGRFPGANGLKVVAGTVYVASTFAGAVYSIETDGQGHAKGAPKIIASVAHADDFAVSKNGTIYIPSAGKVVKISPTGEKSEIAEDCTGCDAALLVDHERSLLLVTHGFGPNAGPGRLYRLKLNQP